MRTYHLTDWMLVDPTGEQVPARLGKTFFVVGLKWSSDGRRVIRHIESSRIMARDKRLDLYSVKGSKFELSDMSRSYGKNVSGALVSIHDEIPLKQ